jgi:pimeloyl-ACP methyl ester carboxylesterase
VTRGVLLARDVATINVPTIVIAGELDRVESVGFLKAKLVPRIPHAVLYVLPGTGHLSPLESSQELARLIRDFADARATGETNGANGEMTGTAS